MPKGRPKWLNKIIYGPAEGPFHLASDWDAAVALVPPLRLLPSQADGTKQINYESKQKALTQLSQRTFAHTNREIRDSECVRTMPMPLSISF